MKTIKPFLLLPAEQINFKNRFFKAISTQSSKLKPIKSRSIEAAFYRSGYEINNNHLNELKAISVQWLFQFLEDKMHHLQTRN